MNQHVQIFEMTAIERFVLLLAPLYYLRLLEAVAGFNQKLPGGPIF